MSLTATTWPYQRETPSSTIGAVGAPAGVSADGSGGEGRDASHADPLEAADADRERADDADRGGAEVRDVGQLDEEELVAERDAEEDGVRPVEDRARADQRRATSPIVDGAEAGDDPAR